MKIQDFHPHLDQFVLEIQYPFGQLYFDRCGQTIIDIERLDIGWYPSSDRNVTGKLDNPEKNMQVQFSNEGSVFVIEKPDNSQFNYLLEDINKTWKILRANFGLEVYNSLVCKFHFLRPTNSWEESEKLLKKSQLNIVVPQQLIDDGYELSIREIVGIFNKNEIEYRLQIHGVTRAKAIDPRGLLKTPARKMSRNQKNYMYEKLKQFHNYNANPMYGIFLNIECTMLQPKALNLNDFIQEQYSIANEQFLPILEKL